MEEAQALLDDHIVKSQAMTASPFAKPFMDRLGPWEKKLVRFQVRVLGSVSTCVRACACLFSAWPCARFFTLSHSAYKSLLPLVELPLVPVQLYC